MNKRVNRPLALVTAAMSMIWTPFAAADTADPETVQAKTTQVHEPAREDGGPARESRPEEGLKLNEYLTLSGLVEVDAIVARDFEGADTSTIELSTVELALAAQATEWASGLVVVTYEEDDFFLDQANITLGKTEELPFFLTAGRVYVPFGYFATNMIQDPLTQFLGEINVEGVTAGVELYCFTGEFFGYKGMKETGEDDALRGVGAALTYTYEQDDTALSTGIAWVNNIADAEGIADSLSEGGIDTLASRVNGLRLHFDAGHGPFAVIGEYTTALDSFASDELALPKDVAESGAKPAAWNTELACTTEILSRETVFAAGYQGSREAVALGLPEQRLIAAVSMEVVKNTLVSLEYYYDQDYAAAEGGTGEDGYGFTSRLAYAF